MFMRLAHARIKPDRFEDFRRLYEERVIPALQNVGGCVYACLVQSVHHPDECISMTLWETQKHAEEYVNSGVFQQLMNEAQPLFADSMEWKVQLTTDFKLEYQPVPEEPIVDSHQVAVESAVDAGIAQPSPIMYLRIVSMKVLPEKREEFERLYTTEVIPALRQTKGCRYAYLTESIKDPDEFFSITIWDSKEDADAYETSGMFAKLKDRVKHTFSDLIQWKMGLGNPQQGKIATSEELAVKGCTFVTGKSMK